MMMPVGGCEGNAVQANSGLGRLLTMFQIADSTDIIHTRAADGATTVQETGWRQLSCLFDDDTAIKSKIANIMQQTGHDGLDNDAAHDNVMQATILMGPPTEAEPEIAHQQALRDNADLRKQVELLTHELQKRDLFLDMLKAECVKTMPQQHEEDAAKDQRKRRSRAKENGTANMATVQQEKGKSMLGAVESWFSGFEKLRRDIEDQMSGDADGPAVARRARNKSWGI